MASGNGEWTFAMVDLAGFTALTESHGDDHAADLATGFADLVRAELGQSDRLVKTIGDAVLLACPEPTSAVHLVRQVITACYSQASYPVARVGINHGPAAQRGDDFFGASVNLAARVAAQAGGGQVLATRAVAAAAQDLGYSTRPLGPIALKNVSEAAELWEVHLLDAPLEHSVDPVCRMLVDHEAAVGRLDHDGQVYWFCSLECVGTFASDPTRYV